MLCCPARSRFNASSRLDGGKRKSSNSSPRRAAAAASRPVAECRVAVARLAGNEKALGFGIGKRPDHAPYINSMFTTVKGGRSAPRIDGSGARRGQKWGFRHLCPWAHFQETAHLDGPVTIGAKCRAPRPAAQTTGRDLPQRTGPRRAMTETIPTKKQNGLPPWFGAFSPELED